MVRGTVSIAFFESIILKYCILLPYTIKRYNNCFIVYFLDNIGTFAIKCFWLDESVYFYFDNLRIMLKFIKNINLSKIFKLRINFYSLANVLYFGIWHLRNVLFCGRKLKEGARAY